MNCESHADRWLTPDPLRGDIPSRRVFDVKPQSLNRYAYALNDPTSLVDPSGLDPRSSTVNRDFSMAKSHP